MSAKPKLSPPATVVVTELEQFIDGLGLSHFRGAELTALHQRVTGGVKNSPPPRHLWPNIVPALLVLDKARGLYGHPVELHSAYRSASYNKAVGGAAGSYHQQFMALDSSPAKPTPQNVERWRAILAGLRGQWFTHPLTKARFAFAGGIGFYPGRFVHTDTRGRDVNWAG